MTSTTKNSNVGLLWLYREVFVHYFQYLKQGRKTDINQTQTEDPESGGIILLHRMRLSNASIFNDLHLEKQLSFFNDGAI